MKVHTNHMVSFFLSIEDVMKFKLRFKFSTRKKDVEDYGKLEKKDKSHICPSYLTNLSF